MTATIKEIALDNDFEFEYQLERKNTRSGVVEAAAGLTGLIGVLSATDGGTAINGSLSQPAVERSGAPGSYFGTYLGTDLRAFCVNLIGTIVYLGFGDSIHELTWEPHQVVARRRPG